MSQSGRFLFEQGGQQVSHGRVNTGDNSPLFTHFDPAHAPHPV